MKYPLHVIQICLFVLIFSCTPEVKDVNLRIEVIEKFSGLQAIIDSEKDKLLIINFWATTCPPCLKEMPHFNQLNEKYKNENIRLLLVSLDDVNHLDSRVYPFVKKHQIIPEVVLLQDQFYTQWNDKIDPSWYGALPATIMINGDKRKFRFGSYETYEELHSDVEALM